MNKKLTRIAIVAWNDVVTSPKSLSKIVGKFQKNGPTLPIEFNRISKDGHLTPIINEKNGTRVPCFYAIAKTKSLKAITKALAKRENINESRISFIDLRNQQIHTRAAEKYKIINQQLAEWAHKNKIDCIVFSSLGPKFKDEIGVGFNVNSATNYLNDLPARQRNNALNYIKKIPTQINTQFRAHLATIASFKKELGK